MTITLDKISKKLDAATRAGFYKLGYAIAERPFRVIALSILVVCVAGIGALNFQSEDRGDKLWVPQDTLSMEQKKIKEENYPDELRVSQIIFNAPDDRDLATQEGVLQLLSVLETVTKVVSSTGITYSDVCETASYGALEFCQTSSMLDIFFDREHLAYDENGNASYIETIRSKLESLSDLEVRQALFEGPYTSWNDITILPAQYMHNYEIANYTSAYKIVVVTEEGSNEEISYEWEVVLEDANFGDLDVYLATQSAREDAGDAQASDVPLLTIGIMLAVAYICTMLGHLNSVQSRFGLGVSAVFSVALAFIAMVGVCSLFSYYGPVHQMLPLLLVAIGIDDAFVIVTAFDDAGFREGKYGLTECIARGLSRSGSAITVTSLTNAFAFFMGSTTRIPAMRYFAFWAGTGILFDFLLQATFFVACLTLDGSRQLSKRRDIICCFKANNTSKKNIFGSEPGALKRFYQRRFAPVLAKKIVYWPVMLASFSLFGASIYGASKLEYHFDDKDLAFEGSPLYEYNEVDASRFSSESEVIPCEVLTGDFDYASEINQQKMTALFKDGGLYESNEYYEPDTLNCWYSDFRDFGNLTDASEIFPPDEFYGLLDQFLSTDDGSAFEADLIFKFDPAMGRERLMSTRSLSVLKVRQTLSDRLNAMDSIRASVDAAGLPDAFPFSFLFLFYDRDSIVRDEAIQILLISLATVFAITLVLIGNIKASAITLLGPCLSVVDMLGMMYFFDIHLNTVSVICLALSVGITIDFSSHVTIGFMNSAGSKEERVAETLGHLGPALTHAGVSTFLCTVVLVFSTTYVFKMFFKMFMLIICFGMFHGLVLVPIILLLVGPKEYFNEANVLEKTREIVTVSHASTSQNVTPAIEDDELDYEQT